MKETFTRTTSGLQNYAKFFSADVTVYIEGRSQNNGKGLSKGKTFDEIFYTSLLKVVNTEKRFIIKPVGSKQDVISYANKISTEDVRNCLAIIDRDYENFLSCWTGDPRLIRTKGYSWESDFWNSAIVASTVHQLAVTHEPLSIDMVRESMKRCAHRLGRVSKIDFIYKILDQKFIPSSKKSVGMEIKPKCRFFSSIKDIRKYKEKLGDSRFRLKQCSTARYFYEKIKTVAGQEFIRGHLWEYACLCIIANFYMQITGERSLPSVVGKNTAFSLFVDKGAKMLEDNVLAHYVEAVTSALQVAVGGVEN